MDYGSKKWLNEGDSNINDYTPKLDADNLNRIEEGIENAHTKIADLKTHVDSHLKPWSTDSNLCKINTVDGEITVSAKKTEPNTPYYEYKTFDIYMINSGDIILKFDISGFGTYAKGHVYAGYVAIFRNDNEVKRIWYNKDNSGTYEWNGQEYDKPFDKIRLSVNKGDVISIEAAGRSYSDETTSLTIKNISLYCNIDTPYKYLNLNEGTSAFTEKFKTGLVYPNEI